MKDLEKELLELSKKYVDSRAIEGYQELKIKALVKALKKILLHTLNECCHLDTELCNAEIKNIAINAISEGKK